MNTDLIPHAREPECASQMESCICMLLATHAGPHICECEGSWDDDGKLLAFPAVVVEDGSPFGPKGSRPFDGLGL